MIKKDQLRRIYRIMTIALFVVLIIYVINMRQMNRKFDSSYPEITFEEEKLEVSVKATTQDLLQGVKAMDKKDGDVTDTIIIESISNILAENERIVTYAAFDKDNHVGKAERRIRYTDYIPIRFSLDAPILMSSDGGATWQDILNPLYAIDCVDGDISDSIILRHVSTSIDKDGNERSVYNVQVTNSCGDMATIELPIKSIEGEIPTANVSIVLEEYLVYQKVGTEEDLRSLIKEVSWRGQNIDVAKVDIASEVDYSTPGSYIVTYSIERDGNSSSCDLIIVVEE